MHLTFWYFPYTPSPVAKYLNTLTFLILIINIIIKVGSTRKCGYERLIKVGDLEEELTASPYPVVRGGVLGEVEGTRVVEESAVPLSR